MRVLTSVMKMVEANEDAGLETLDCGSVDVSGERTQCEDCVETFRTKCEDCEQDVVFSQCPELPYGWEKVEDPHYGTYFIDHVNRKTQYENPVQQAKRLAQEGELSPSDSSQSGPSSPRKGVDGNRNDNSINGRKSPPAYGTLRPAFTKNPGDLKGEFLQTELVKSPRGFGFTIVGGDDSDEEFLQIKSVVPSGPAYADGSLKRGDVLVRVNTRLVLGFTHQDVVNLFQSIPIGQKVKLQVCRGYLLPFDPDDPNTEIVTTVAVTLPPATATNNTSSTSMSKLEGPNQNGLLGAAQRNIKSMPNLNKPGNHVSSQQTQNRSVDEADSPSLANIQSLSSSSSQAEMLTVNIVKGTMGFGFTIADSAYGQKVKQILDRQRCQTLMEGDILVGINQTRVKDFSHSEVVEVLKSCTKGQAAAISVQRGGILTPSRGRKTSKSPRTVMDEKNTNRMTENTYANVPHPYADIEDKANSEDSKQEEPKVKDTEDEQKAEVNKEGEETENNNSEEIGDQEKDRLAAHGGVNRAHTPTFDQGQGQSEHRPRTPVMSDMSNARLSESRTSGRMQPMQAIHPAHVPDNSEGGPHPHAAAAAYQDYNTPHQTPNRPYRGLDPPGAAAFSSARRGEFPNHSFSEYDRTDGSGGPPGGLAESRGRGEVRSRTPGPEFMRGWDKEEDAYLKQNTSQPRSKTPTPHEMSGDRFQNISGTPDFIPASLYSSPASSQADNQGGPNPAMDKSHSASNMQNSRDAFSKPGRAAGPAFNPMSASYPSPSSSRSNFGSMSSSYNTSPVRPQSPSRPSKQSTSFEKEEPVPTRLPHGAAPWGEDSPSSSLDRSRSPARFGDDPAGVKYTEMSVVLRRHDSGFGFRIIGGTEEGSQVSVGDIVPSGAAEMDGRLKPGDEILYVDSQCVVGSSHRRVVQLMGQAGVTGVVTLNIRRRIGGPPITLPNELASRAPGLGSGQENFPYEVTVTRREDEGFGFVIISSITRAGSVIGGSQPNLSRFSSRDWIPNKRVPHPWIGKIIEESPAERCGRLKVGDRILAVNGINILRMHHEEIVNIIKDSGYSASLTIGPPQDEVSSNASNSQRSSQGSMINAMAFPAQSESDISRRSEYSPYHNPGRPPHPSAGYDTRLPPGSVGDKLAPRGQYQPQAPASTGEEDKYYVVELHRGSRGFGFSIRGGKEFSNMPLYVLRIADGGAANLDRRLQVGDQLIEINSYNTSNMTHTEAIDLIQSGGSSVRLLVKRTGKLPPQLGNQGPGPGVRPSTSSSHVTPLPNGPLGQSSPLANHRAGEPGYSPYGPAGQHSRQHSGY